MANTAHFVEIPGAETEGLYRYNEPETPHPLQVAFLDPAQEAAYAAGLRELLVAGRFDDAAALIAHDLEGFSGRTARIAKAARSEDIRIEGWADLGDIVAEFEGPAISCITAGLGNAPGLVFAAGQTHEPELLFNLYSDDEFAFSGHSDAELLAACEEDCPGWIGHEEDVEFYCAVEGLAELNTALIQCRHRIYDRADSNALTDRAPGGHVEYRLACWWRTTLFLQAIAREIREHGLPEGCRLIVGTFGMDADVATVLGERKASAALPSASRPAHAAPATMASLTMGNWERGNFEVEAEPSTGATLRQKVATPAAEPSPTPAPEAAPAEAVEEKPGSRSFFARLFGR